MNEHDIEPVKGLPERPPQGESVLWQGAPSWRSLSQRLFHVRAIALYFAVIMAWRVASSLADGATAREVILSALVLVPVLLTAVALFALIAWLISRSTVYTITNRRIVLRIGVALPITINVPFRVIEAAKLKAYADGTGDISVSLIGSERLGYLIAWPHVRPWRLARPEPTLRGIPGARQVADVLARALAAAPGPAVTAPAAEASEPAARLGGERRPLVNAA